MLILEQLFRVGTVIHLLTSVSKTLLNLDQLWNMTLPCFSYIFFLATDWKDHVVGSNSFDNPSGHQNPNGMPVNSYTKEADFVRVGAFVLSKGIKLLWSDLDKCRFCGNYPSRDEFSLLYSLQKLSNFNILKCVTSRNVASLKGCERSLIF